MLRSAHVEVLQELGLLIICDFKGNLAQVVDRKDRVAFCIKFISGRLLINNFSCLCFIVVKEDFCLAFLLLQNFVEVVLFIHEGVKVGVWWCSDYKLVADFDITFFSARPSITSATPASLTRFRFLVILPILIILALASAKVPLVVWLVGKSVKWLATLLLTSLAPPSISLRIFCHLIRGPV